MVRDGRDGQRRFARVKVPPLLSRFQVDGRRRPALPARAGHRRAPPDALPGHGGRVLAPVPGDPQRRPHGRRRGGRRPAGRRRDAAPPAALRPGRAPRGRRRDARRRPGAAPPGAAARRRRPLRDATTPRPRLAVGALRPQPAGAEVPGAGRPSRPRASAPSPATSSPCCAARDVLVHHPYESFATVEAFIDQAAADPDVLAIKQTMYRTSLDSAIPRALIRAAERGKQVAVLVELTARFSEEVNIAWARRLEEAGVHVVYGLVGLKTGCKATLVVRRERGELRRYCHIGTGNYDASTARQYEDVGLLTADEDIGADLSDLFNYLTGLQPPERLPQARRRPGRAPAADPGTDPGDVGRARRPHRHEDEQPRRRGGHRRPLRGVGRRLRDRPRHPGHLPAPPRRARAGRSGSGSGRSSAATWSTPGSSPSAASGDATRYFIGSADLTPSNLDRRVQLLCPVEDAALAARLEEILAVNLADTSRRLGARAGRFLEPGFASVKKPRYPGFHLANYAASVSLTRTGQRPTICPAGWEISNAGDIAGSFLRI